MVSEPTPVAEFSGGVDWTVTAMVIVVTAPPWVTLAVIVLVPGTVQTPSIRFVHLFVPPAPAVTVLGWPVTFHVQAVLELDAFTVKPDGMPATTVFFTVTAGLAGCAWAVAVRPSVPSVAAVAAATISFRMSRALSLPGLLWAEQKERKPGGLAAQ